MQPYVYELTFTETGQKYIGCRFSQKSNPDELWRSYFSSSAVIYNLIKNFGKSAFSSKIIKTFNSIEETLDFEKQLIKEHGLENLLNLHEGTGSSNLADHWNQIFKKEKIHRNWNIVTNGTETLVLSWNVKVPEGYVHINKGRISITNGNVFKRIPFGSEIPEGWRIESQMLGKFYITNGIKRKRIHKDQTIPDGWWKENTTSGKKLCTDGKDKKWFIESEIPEGWKIYKQQRVPSFWINDGSKELQLPISQEIPRGFCRGRLPRIMLSRP